MATAVLQLEMHRAGVGPATLIPLPSGTVLLPHASASLNAHMRIAAQCKPFTGRAVVFCWDDSCAISYALLGRIPRTWFWGGAREANGLTERAQHYGPIGFALTRLLAWTTGRLRKPARAEQVAGVLAAALGVDPSDEQVKARVGDWERGGPEVITGLLRDVRLPDVAQVVELVHAGQAEPWVATLPAPAAKVPYLVVFPVIGLLLLLGAVLLGLSLVVPMMIYAAISLTLIGFSGVIARRPVKGKPINAVLPVIPVTQGAVPTEQPPA